MDKDAKSLTVQLEESRSQVKQLKLQVEAFKRYLPQRVVEKILSDPSFIRVEGEYRLVTILFADISGFTHLSEELSKIGKKGAEEITEIVNIYFTRMFDIASQYGGTIHKLLGDAIIVLFGAPIIHEDDPERAVRAAIDMQAAMKSFKKMQTSRGVFHLRMSIGINTGIVVAGNVGSEKRMEYTVMGDSVNLAARLEQKAKPGEILISKTSYDKVEKIFDVKPLKPVRVKGKAKPIQMYRVLGVSKHDREEPEYGTEPRARIIGRQQEMRVLRKLMRKALSGKGQVVSVVGDAGTGKSRLIDEFNTWLSSPRVTAMPDLTQLEGRCPSYGGAILYGIVLELLRSFFAITESDSDKTIRRKIEQKSERLGLDKYVPYMCNLFSLDISKGIIGHLDAKAMRQVTLDAVKSCLVAESENRPVVLIFEDFHWVDNSSLGLLQHVMKNIENARILIICVYRRSERNLPQGLKQGIQGYYTDLPVAELTHRESEVFAKSVLGTRELPDELKRIIIERSAGNPLYLQELLNSLIESEVLKKELGKWKLASVVSEFEVPDSVEGVVMARLDRLDEKVRRVLRTASVIGRSFQYRVLKHIWDTPGLDECLSSLQERGIIHKRIGASEPEYLFRHVLTREVAYNSLLNKTRVRLHERIAMCIENLYKNKLEESLGLLAHHYSQSANSEKAVLYLTKAGRKSEQLYAGKEALDHYTRALSILEMQPERDERVNINLLSNRGNVWRQFLGDRKRALADYEEAIRLSQLIGDRPLEARSLRDIGGVLRGTGQYEKALSCYEKAMHIFKEVEDARAIAGLLNRIAVVYDDMGKFEKALSLYEKSLDAGKRVNDDHIMAAVLNNIGIIYDNRGDYDKALKCHNEALDIETRRDDKRGIAINVENIGIVYSNLNECKKALLYFERALKIFDDISDRSEMGFCLTNIGSAHYKLGKYSEALEHQKRALEIQQELGAKWGIANSLDEIGMVYQELGDFKSAVHHHDRSLTIAKEIGARVIEANALINLGIVRFRLNQKKESGKLIKRGISIADEVGSKEVMDYGRRALGEIENG